MSDTLGDPHAPPLIGALLRTTKAKAVLAGYAIATLVCAFLPLIDHLGFEFASVMTWVSAVLAPFVGFAAMELEQRVDAGQRRPARAAATAGFVAVGALLLPIVLILLNGLRRPICEPVSGLFWMCVLAAPTAWLCASLGALARLITRRIGWAIALVAAVELLIGLTTALQAIYGPPIFAFDHFAGWIPGIVRDDVLALSPALASFRAATVLWGAAAVALCGALASGDPLARRMHLVWAVGLSLLLIAISAGWGSRIGWRTTDRSLRKALAGEIEVDGVILHFPRTLGERGLETAIRTTAYEVAEARRALGVTPTHPIHVWMYPSLDQRLRLVGSRTTAFAKPYRNEVHMLGIAPGGSLRHELIHAMGAEFARGPWKVPGGLIPNSVLIEGFAMAYDVDDGPLTLPQEAKAMRDVKLAPDLERMLSPGGFNREATTRAYSYSGAFIRYLDGRFGTPAMRNLYLTSDLATLGSPKALIADFERMLDTVQSDSNSRATATRRHIEPSIMKQRCPREAVAVVDSAWLLAQSRQWDASLAMFDKACALQPENAVHFRNKLTVAINRRADDPRPMLAVAESLWRHPRLDPSLELGARVQVGSDLWRRGDTASARAQFEMASALPADPDSRRRPIVRLRALATPYHATLLKPLLAESPSLQSQLAQALRMSDALVTRPNDAFVLYLLGKEFNLAGAHEKAGDLFEKADAIGLGDADLARDNLRTLITARVLRHRCDDAERALGRLAAAGGSQTERGVAADEIRRCRFFVSRGWSPL